MNRGLLLERDGTFSGIRGSYHSNRDVILRGDTVTPPSTDAASSSNRSSPHWRRRRNDDGRAMDHSTVSNADHSQHGGASTRSRAEQPKPQWRGGAHRKCWVCNNIRCTCEHSTLHANGSRGSSAVDTSVTSRRAHNNDDSGGAVDRSAQRHLLDASHHATARRHGRAAASDASARSVSPNQKAKRGTGGGGVSRSGAVHDSASDVSNSFVRAHTHAAVATPSAVDRLHRGLSARPKEQFHGIAPASTAPIRKPSSTTTTAVARLAPPPSNNNNKAARTPAGPPQESPRPGAAASRPRGTSRSRHVDPQAATAAASLTSPQTVTGTRRVVRHRLWYDEHGHAHSSEIDDEEIVSTATSAALTNNTNTAATAGAAGGATTTTTTPRGSSVPPTVGRMRLHNRTYSGGGAGPPSPAIVAAAVAATTPEFTLPDVSSPSQPRPQSQPRRQQHHGERSQSTGRSRPHEDVGERNENHSNNDDDDDDCRVGVSPSRLVQMAEQGSSNDSPPPPRIAVVEPSVSPAPAAMHPGPLDQSLARLQHHAAHNGAAADTSANLPSPIPKVPAPVTSDTHRREHKHRHHHRHRHHRRHHHRHGDDGEGSYTSSSSRTTTTTTVSAATADGGHDGSEFILSDGDAHRHHNKKKHHHRHRHRRHHHHGGDDDGDGVALRQRASIDAKGSSAASAQRRTASAPSRHPPSSSSSKGHSGLASAATPQPEVKKRLEPVVESTGRRNGNDGGSDPTADAAATSKATEEADELRRQVALLTSRQRELQAHVATAESQLATLVAQRTAQQHQAASAHHTETATAASSDVDDLPVHPAFRPPAAKSAASPLPPPPQEKRYKGGVPMGGGVGHIKPPNDHYRGSGNSRRGRAPEASGYGGYLVRGLVHVATMPFTCCLRPQASDDDDDDDDGVAAGPGDVAAVAERSGLGLDAAGADPAVDPRLLAEAFAAAQAREAAAAATAAAEATAQAEADLRAMEVSLANAQRGGNGIGSMSASTSTAQDAPSSPAAGNAKSTA